MPYLVRRISRAKWDNENYDYHKSDNAPADAITACLRTFNNELSTWLVDDDDLKDVLDSKEFLEAILCLATGSKQQNLNKMELIFFPLDLLTNNNIQIKQTVGDTVIKGFQSKHYDILNLNYDNLKIIKDIVLDCLRNDRYLLYAKNQVKNLLVNAAKEDVLDANTLNKDFRKALGLKIPEDDTIIVHI